MILELYVEVGWGELMRTLNDFSYKTQLLLLSLCWWFLYLSFQTRTLSWIIDICLSSCQVQCLRNLTKDSNNMFKFEQYLFHSSLLFLLYSQLYWRDYKWLRSPNQKPESPSSIAFIFQCNSVMWISASNVSSWLLFLIHSATVVTKGFCLLFMEPLRWSN